MIRIPRKKKKYYQYNTQWFPFVPKVQRYYSYFFIEDGIRTYKMGAEELCNTFGRYSMDDVIWWNWVRWKELGIKPEMSDKYQEYWDYFIKECVIIKEKEICPCCKEESKFENPL